MQSSVKLQHVATIEIVACNIAHRTAEVESDCACAKFHATVSSNFRG